MSLLQLPEDLILHIHWLSRNPSFPIVHPLIYSNLHYSSPHYKATYLLTSYPKEGHSYLNILQNLVRYPICTVPIMKTINAILRQRQNPLTPDPYPPDVEGLWCPELPRRIFRNLTPQTPIPELLIHLIDMHQAPINSHQGYGFCKAVMAKNIGLIIYMLEKGADPGLNKNLAVEIAIGKKDLELVKLLIEPRQGQGDSNYKLGEKRKRYDDDEDRILVTTKLIESALKCGANDIVDYLVYDKHGIPPLKQIMRIGSDQNHTAITTGKRRK